MSQANLAWQLMMGTDDKIVIGTLNRDAWKSTELTQKEAQCVVRSSRYTETNRRIDELCRCKSSNIIAESDTNHPKRRHSPYVAAKMISKARETVKMLVLETDQTDPNTMEESGSFGQIIDRLFTTAGNNHDPPLGIEVEMLFVVEDEVSPANFAKSARTRWLKLEAGERTQWSRPDGLINPLRCPRHSHHRQHVRRARLRCMDPQAQIPHHRAMENPPRHQICRNLFRPPITRPNPRSHRRARRRLEMGTRAHGNGPFISWPKALQNTRQDAACAPNASRSSNDITIFPNHKSVEQKSKSSHLGFDKSYQHSRLIYPRPAVFESGPFGIGRDDGEEASGSENSIGSD